ncbi:class I SAM-dependent RNA methyltransferase [Ancrocorticia populi]|uniref:Class I SAM-dependent RNA methyltransferase n=1 Tax=Ancrocorticia populi TaxID=2175228 RepID=A0A2V1K6E4_9ACTO|nr:TRAM domain-containing protein [Ancrocorticia populi]PWF24562.1 class I SAM-dependent RNA methyltransferase [Ancrocorticia populi]
MIDIELTDIAHGGACVGHSDGRAVFARFGLPGERVRVAVTEERSKLLRGDVVEVLDNPSPHRIDHPWPVAGPLGVGGAELGHVEFDYQSEWKTYVLNSTLRRIGGQRLVDHLAESGIQPHVFPFDGDRANGGWHTRTRVELTVDADGFPAMYRNGTRETVAVGHVPLAVAEIDDLEVFGGSWAGQFRPGQRLRAVAPSGSDPVLMIDKNAFWAPLMPAEPYVREDVVVGHNLYSYRVRANGFWQVHREAAAQLIAMVMRAAAVQPGDNVVELYSGAGLLTQPLAIEVGQGGSVQSLEGVRQAVEDARANLREFSWATSRTSAVSAQLVGKEAGDVVIADPPRAGLGQEIATILAGTGANRIVLVSCDPASMARDIRAMVDAGRKVVSMESVDMFPNTHHFEVVTALV